jgi:2-oxoglutarate ferredoxin oxidoreductase subunit alpha
MRTIVNDFSIHVATVNGSGSQTANNVLLRAIFQMGIPVSGKNLFPSNIAGLPTWFTIRASKDGWVARRGGHEVLVVMNPETAAADVAEMGPGTVIVANDSIKFPPLPDDRVVYAVPMAKLMESITTDVNLRRRARGVAGDRSDRGRQGAPRPARQEAQGDGAEPGGGAGRHGVCAGALDQARPI